MFYGALAQLGERLICIQEVRSSILLGSTISQRFDLTVKHQFECFTVQSDVASSEALTSFREIIISTLFDRAEVVALISVGAAGFGLWMRRSLGLFLGLLCMPTETNRVVQV